MVSKYFNGSFWIHSKLAVSVVFPYREPDRPEYIRDIPFLQVVSQRQEAPTTNEEYLKQGILAQEEMARFSAFLKSRYFSG